MFKTSPKYIVDEKGKVTHVLLSIDEFHELLELVEDVIDGEDLQALRHEPTLDWDQFRAETSNPARPAVKEDE